MIRNFTYLFSCSIIGITIDSNGNAFVAATGGSNTGGNANSPATVFRSTLASQYGVVTNISPVGSSSNDLRAITSLVSVLGHVIAVGFGGTIFYSKNAYQSTPTWVVANSTTTKNLFCVASSGANYAVAGGLFRTLLMTKDGGVTWKSLTPAVSKITAVTASSHFQFHAISMLSQAVIYASLSTGAIIRTVNGGFSFTLETVIKSPSGMAVQLNAIAMFNTGLAGLAFDNVGNSYVKGYTPTASPSFSPAYIAPTPTPTSPTALPSPVPSPKPSATPSFVRAKCMFIHLSYLL